MIANKVSREEVCKKYGICNATITNIVKCEEEIKSDCLKRDKKRNRDCKYAELEKYLFEWFLEKRRLDVPINGPILCSKAVDLAAMCLDDSSKNFKPTNGWIGRFKEGHNINWHKISGEKNSADLDLANTWVDTVLPRLTDGYTHDCIYNADETGLF